MRTKNIFLIIAASLLAMSLRAADAFVNFQRGDWQLNAGGRISICVSDADQRGVRLAAQNLVNDLKAVCGANVAITADAASAQIVVGTVGSVPAVKTLEPQLRGKHEQYIIDARQGQLVIAGSDRRGTIYGIYELSQQIGVSPWYYWADAPIEHHDKLYVKNGSYTDGEPAVRWRGLFLNDEAPCLTGWVKNTFGTDYGDHHFYAKVFELILRLKGNMLWPAMWMWTFYGDDPENLKTADEAGVIIGTSHHEPMARNHQEYVRHRKEIGAWNYATNQKNLDEFFRGGVERMKNTDDVVTIGMRGDGDEAMSADADTKLLKKVIDNQRKIIAKATGKPADKTPQVWALYKEVQDYYDAGLRVPDDVTILISDDNWGNIRRVPDHKRKGGWGIYYHVDYVGAPRNSKWINVTQTQQMFEQLSLAYDFGIEKMWILNVGDLKPMEYPIQFFLDMAWNPATANSDVVTTHTRPFCAEQFGEEYADKTAELLNKIGWLNGRVTPEMLDANTYNVETGEWQQVVGEYTALEADALRLYLQLPENLHDSYRQLVLFPIQAMTNLYQMYEAVAMNHYLAKLSDPAANEWAKKAKEAFKRDSVLCAQYNHDIADGKWNHMMTQKHIGYRTWNDNFPKDRLPELMTVSESKDGGYIFDDNTAYISMEAAHYFASKNASKANWQELPFIGRTLSGMALSPYTEATDDASLTYKFRLNPVAEKADKFTIHIIVKSTLDYKNKGGMEYEVTLDNGEKQTINFNHNLNEKPENIYNIYYPTIARRVVESTITLPAGKDEWHTLTIHPKDPGIVFEKIVVDAGGYKPSYLFMRESAKKR